MLKKYIQNIVDKQVIEALEKYNNGYCDGSDGYSGPRKLKHLFDAGINPRCGRLLSECSEGMRHACGTDESPYLEEFDKRFPNSRDIFQDNDPFGSRRRAIKSFLSESIHQAEQEGYERGEQNIVKKINEFGTPCMLLNGVLHMVSYSPPR